MLRWAAITLSLALGACATVSPPIERLVVFGDSNVDNGNAFRSRHQATVLHRVNANVENVAAFVRR